MNYLNDLLPLQQLDFRNYVKNNIGDSNFISEICGDRETYVPLLLKNKIIPQQIEDKISEEKNGVGFLLDKYVEYGYIPGVEFFNKLLGLSDEHVLKFLKSFPSFHIPVSSFIKLINHNYVDSALFAVKEKKDLQKDDIIYLLVRSGVKDDYISSLAIGSKILLLKIAKEIEETSGKIDRSTWVNACPKVIGEALQYCKDVNIESISGLNLPKEALQKIFLKEKEKRSDPTLQSWMRHFRHSSIKWVPGIEEIDIDFIKSLDIFVIDPPMMSKFRKDWLKHEPKQASNEELIQNKDEFSLNLNKTVGYGRGKDMPLISTIILRGRVVLDHYGVKEVLDQASSSCIEGALSVLLNEDKIDYILYLFENAPTRLRKTFRKKIPLNKHF